MSLPQKLPLELLDNQWSAQLNPLLANPLNNASILEDVPLRIGVNVINHKLGRKMQGWFLTDIQGAATIYRSAAFNSLTLILTSDATVTVNLGVF